MGRWEPDAEGRLRHAALDLFVEQGYESTTVADIADRAGVTSRTFFRYFADKREVLFGGSEELQARMVEAVRGCPRQAPPLQSVGAALSAAGDLLGGDRAWSRQRQLVIDSTAELRERELNKLASLGAALAAALREREVGEPEASLLAEAALVAVRIGFGRWVREAHEDVAGPAGELGALLLDTLRRLRELMGQGLPGADRRP